jgi:hypothetical protein
MHPTLEVTIHLSNLPIIMKDYSLNEIIDRENKYTPLIDNIKKPRMVNSPPCCHNT